MPSLDKPTQDEEASSGFRPGDVPASPGIYIFRDRLGNIIYVGKAANLRRRMSQYFQKSRLRHADPKLLSLVNSIVSWEYRTVKTDSEALLLESRLIKEYAPYYNTLMRDDKRFLMIRINPSEELPRLRLARLRRNDGSRYFGPFPKGGALRDTVEFLTRHFGLRTCKADRPGETDHRHCLAKNIRDCCAPCVGRTSLEAYKERVGSLLEVLEGRTDDVIAVLQSQMQQAAAEKKFEKAAKCRDIIQNIRETFGRGMRNFRFADLKSPAGPEAVADLEAALGIDRRPDTIEAFDISNISGQLSVGSMVRFDGGTPDRKNYRHFKIRTVQQPDDFAMMREIVARRYRRLVDEGKTLPDLVLIDGGKGQLSAAISAFAAENIPPTPIISLAKRNEEIFIPGMDEPLVLDRARPALRLLQSIRDEAHRFAISYHRCLREKRIQESILDEIQGVGPERKKAILNAFGSIADLKKASPDEIAAKVPGIGHELAKAILEKIR